MSKQRAKQATSRKQTAPAKKKFPVLPVAFGAVAVLLIVAIVLGFDSGGGEFGDPALAGENLPGFAGDPNADPAVGMAYSRVTGADFDGNPVTIEPNGTPKAIVFLAHWCGVCQAEVPAVQAWVNQGRLPQGIELISVATLSSSGRQNYPPSAWLEREGWTAPVIVDDSTSSISQAFGLSGTPFWAFTDGNGNIVLRSSGLTDISVLEAYLTVLAAGASNG
jgi:thiol-disulfide isomerase/thioredoxin